MVSGSVCGSAIAITQLDGLLLLGRAIDRVDHALDGQRLLDGVAFRRGVARDMIEKVVEFGGVAVAVGRLDGCLGEMLRAVGAGLVER